MLERSQVTKKADPIKTTIEQPTKEKVEDPKEDILKEAIEKTAKVENTKEVRVLVHSLNVRSNANSNAQIVKVVRSGDTLTVNTTTVGKFYQVIEPVKGYVMTEYVG